ncbi:MAG: hypothetical protein JRJ60_03210 [Deltaproteobacteria bacterium]|nr:hypothetical protein [Deltaproteobacteria bacterium]
MLKKSLFLFLGLALCLSFGAGSAIAQGDEVKLINGGPSVYIAPGGIGDLGLAALYDVRDTEERTDAWENYVVIENTTGRWVAFHLRFRGWRKSIEVYDHIVLMSPYDVFWFILKRAVTSGPTGSGTFEAGDVVIMSADTETLLNSGLVYPDDVVGGEVLWVEKFQDLLLKDCGFNEPAYNLKEEMQAGHFEVIGVWSLTSPSGCEDTHNLANVVRDLYKDGHSVSNVYDVLEALFYERLPGGAAAPGWACGLVRISGMGPTTVDDDNETGLDGKYRWGDDCGNVLTGSVEMYDTGTGRYELENIVFLMNFRTGGYGEYYFEGYWPHRDGYWGGAIVYPTSIMEWVVDYYGGTYLHPAWYVNENWATTVGPGLRDGDDKNFCCNEFLPDFNNTWSLDDLELALSKSELWYQYFDLVTFDGAVVTSDVVLTYPTKHYHWFFRDWPYYNGQMSMWGDNCSTPNPEYPTSACYSESQINCDCGWGVGNWSAYYDCTNGWNYWTADGKARIFANNYAYYAAVDSYRGVKAEPGACTTTGSIAAWFLGAYQNGPIGTKVTMWDMEENTPGSTPGEPPPGSPWRPTIDNPDFIPHEVNIARVGLVGGEGIMAASSFFLSGPAEGFTEGHWRTLTHVASNGQRGIGAGCCEPLIDYLTNYMIPPIGLVIFTHTYGIDVDGITRSAMAEWHFKSDLMDISWRPW